MNSNAMALINNANHSSPWDQVFSSRVFREQETRIKQKILIPNLRAYLEKKNQKKDQVL